MIHLKQIRFAFLVQNNVETENFKAHEIFDVRRLANPIVVDEVLLDWKKRFYNYVFNFTH